MSPVILIVGIYLFLCLGIGLYAKRRTRTAKDFLIASRRLPIWIASLTLAATLIGSGVTIGVGELGYEAGVSAMLYPTILGVSLLISMLIASAKFRREGYYTVPEALEKHYGLGARVWVCGAGLIALIPAVAAQFLAAGAILTALTGISLHLMVIVGGIVILAYVVLGGMWAISWTDALQMIIIYIGLTSMAIFSIVHFGTMGTLTAGLPPIYSSWTGVGSIYLSAWIACLLMLVYISQPWLQRSASITSPKNARKAGVIAALLVLPIGFLAVYAGLVARITMPGIDPMLAVPSILLTYFPAFIGGFFCAAIIAACMSCADSWIHSAATIFTIDVYKRLINPKASERRMFFYSRIICLAIGLGGLSSALLFEGGIIFLVLLGVMMGSCLYIGPLLVAWFSPLKLKKNAGLAIIIIVTIVGIVWFLSYPWPFGIHPALPATLIGYGLTGLFLLFPFCVKKR